MDELIAYLKSSIADEVFSKNEKKSFKSLLQQQTLSVTQLQVLRSKIYEMANEHISPANYQFILEWVKTATSALDGATTPTTKESALSFFSPGDSCRNAIVQQIERATTQLQICVFTISDDSITKSLLAAHKKGITIKLITDNDKSLDEGSDIEMIASAGIAVKMDTTSNHMHHKFMVADQKSLITGSYNWTRSAARYNHENIILLIEPGIVKSFSQQFDSLWNTMKEFH